jgi:hypothetical protein
VINKNSGDLFSYASYTWRQTNIPSFVPDPVMPAIEKYLSYVKFKPESWKSWNDISRWFYNELLKPFFNTTDSITYETKGLVKNCPNELDKIKCIFYFIQFKF